MRGLSRPASRAVAWTIAVLVMAVPLGASAQDLPAPRSMGLTEARFEAPQPGGLRQSLINGLTSYVVRDTRVPLVRYTALIDAGSADGSGGTAFAAALRAGPASLGPGQFRSRLRQMAALFEVAQGQAETRVTLEVPVEDADAALELFAALLQEPRTGTGTPRVTSAVDAATGESGPVLYEGSLDTAVELLEQAVFSNHPYSGSYPDGAPSSASEFIARFVAPPNIALAVSGDFETQSMRDRVADVFGPWNATAAAPSAHPAATAPSSRRVLLYPAAKLQGWVAIGHELPAVPAADEAALMVMNYVLGGGHFDTRLFRATRDRRGLTNDDSGFPEAGS